MTPFAKVLLTVTRVKSSLYIEFTIVNIVGDLVSKSLAVKPPLAGDVPLSGWRGALTTPSLPEAHRSIPVRPDSSWFRKILAFAGPGYLIAVGYMDPGNWATDIGGGSKFGYVLLSAVLISSLMAMFLQALAARFGVATGRDSLRPAGTTIPAQPRFFSGLFVNWRSPPAISPKSWVRPSP